MINYIIVAVIAYLLGNVQTSYIIGRAIKKVDIRDYGSGNAGMTNALRVLGKRAAIATFAIDVLKGVAATIIGEKLLGLNGELIGGLFVILGHNFPFYLKFRGGKGVTTSIGVAIVVAPIAAIISLLIGLPIIIKTRYMSLGVLIGIGLWPIIDLILNIIKGSLNYKVVIFEVILAVMVFIKHKENIKRLLNHKENKIGSKQKG